MVGPILEIALAALLLLTGLEKALAARHWRATLRRYPLWWLDSSVVAWGVPVAEVGTAAALIAGVQPLAGVLASAVFLSFAVVLWGAYRRGARHDCGCWGPRIRARIGPSAITRALALSLLGLSTALIDGDEAAWYVRLAMAWAIALGGLVLQEIVAPYRAPAMTRSS